MEFFKAAGLGSNASADVTLFAKADTIQFRIPKKQLTTFV
jgi:hypothetical protein